jgi:RHS repeat-associated protein
MNLLAESELSQPREKAIIYEYIWFNGHPVAQVDGGTETHWTFTDHLGTPLLQTTSSQAIWWRAEYEPYGRILSLRTSTQHQPLRLPGQESEELNISTDGNGATERLYNVFRWYRSGWGRYAQSDPISSAATPNPYQYALANPLRVTDLHGLFAEADNFVITYVPTLRPPICPPNAGGACTVNVYAYIFCQCTDCIPVRANPTLVLGGNIRVFSGDFRSLPLRPSVDKTVVNAATAIAHEHLYHLDHGTAVARDLAAALDSATFGSKGECQSSCDAISAEVSRVFLQQIHASQLGETAYGAR